MRANFVILLKLLTILLILLNSINCRKLRVELNPNSTKSSNTDNYNLVYIRSDGSYDSIHYLWSSSTAIPPTLLIVKTGLQSNIEVNWQEFNSTGSKQFITFSSNPFSSFGLQFSELYFFNDIDESGSYDKNYPIFEINWNQFVWKKVEIPKEMKDSIKLSFSNLDKLDDPVLNGSTIAFELRVDSSEGRNEDLPHLAFTESSASLAFSVVDVDTKMATNFNQTNRPRLMTSVLVVRNGLTDASEPSFETSTSIDDEYTPGVFDRIYLKLNSKESESSENSNSFLYWKPIAYNSKERIIANTLDVIHSKVENMKINAYNSRVLEGYFGLKPNSSQSFNLTFGASDDTDYYDTKQFVGFSLVVGLGSAPDEKLSLLVQMIILVGFGLPLLVMVVSALYLIVRRFRKRKSDDLLLNQQISDIN